MKYLFIIVLSITTFNANAGISNINKCSDVEQLRLYVIGGGTGALVGLALGSAAAATLPVSAIGGPLAITYFSRTPMLFAWLMETVIPMVVGTAVGTGITGMLVSHGIISKNCGEELTTK